MPKVYTPRTAFLLLCCYVTSSAHEWIQNLAKKDEQMFVYLNASYIFQFRDAHWMLVESSSSDLAHLWLCLRRRSCKSMFYQGSQTSSFSLGCQHQTALWGISLAGQRETWGRTASQRCAVCLLKRPRQFSSQLQVGNHSEVASLSCKAAWLLGLSQT